MTSFARLIFVLVVLGFTRVVGAPEAAPATGVRPAPPAAPRWDGPTALEVLEKRGGFTRFLELCRKTGFMPRLTGGGPYTVLAVPDRVFDGLSESQRNAWFNAPHVAQQRANGMVFFLRDAWPVEELFDTELLSLSGHRVKVTVAEGVVKFQDAVVTERDLRVGNGVIHVLDRPLVPPTVPPAADRKKSGP
ncbi:MAG: fasciclin domain-containing protein [Opitutaceae bacterium]|nr:fasciclin domain-containing protein [Opitutaceae bacterium]